jgi:nucleoside-diphosphate-sugar epimerase
MKKILILGSEGQIGTHLKYYLTNKKYDVLEFDIINSRYQDLRISNNKKLQLYIKKCDFIFFLAFDVGGSKYLKKYQKTYHFLMNNVSIMKNTFEQIKKNKKQFIFVTSQMSNMSHSSYGVLKKIGEQITESLNGISVRLWNVYGIEKDLEKSHVITDFILKGLKNKRIKMITNGEEKRDFLYAEDCCAGFETIMKKFHILNHHKVIDLNYGKYVKIIKIAKIIKDIFFKNNLKIRITKGKELDQVQKNLMNASNKVLRKYWSPKYSLNKGIEEVFTYYKNAYKKNL